MTAAGKQTSEVDSTAERPFDRWDFLLACILVLFVALLRAANRGPLYFVDGPRIVWSIQQGFYTIQPPGYLTLAHLAALFHDPAFGLAFWAVTFSALGAGVFYSLCRLRQSDRLIAFLATFGYLSVYYVWFAGEIHSSYASQILFPALSLFSFFRMRSTGNTWWAVAWAFSASAGMAIRPSDGVFLLPLWIYLLLRHVRQLRVWVIFAAINALAYLAWYIPTQHALAFSHQGSTGTTIRVSMQTVSILLVGFNGRSLANLARVIVPFTVALWALVPALLSGRNREDTQLAALWAGPGLCFFALCYMADPTYLVYLTGALFWLTAIAPKKRRALTCLVICIVFNCALFLFAKPVGTEGLVNRLADFYVIKYCRYGLQHQWSSTVGDGARVP